MCDSRITSDVFVGGILKQWRIMELVYIMEKCVIST